MAATINYDKPVADFIAGLDATGHVTHTKHRKLSVTFHHNGGRLSLPGILEVWKTRAASAHFQVDGVGAVGQYVRLTEYAWATGNTQGNQESVSIEMANATTAPGWTVSDATIEEACRLAGWIFARAFGFAPTNDNVHHHYDWKSTTCSGPYVRTIRAQMLKRVQEWYGFFAGTPTEAQPIQTPTPAPVDTRKSVDQIADEVIAGQWGSGDVRKRKISAAGYSFPEVQARVNAKLGAAVKAPANNRKSIEQIANEVIAGQWGNNPERGQRLQAAGYNPSEVQNAVNAKFGTTGKATPVRPSITQLAREVIAGQWGNGPTRRTRLAQAGYDPAAVQAEVNRIL